MSESLATSESTSTNGVDDHSADWTTKGELNQPEGGANGSSSSTEEPVTPSLSPLMIKKAGGGYADLPPPDAREQTVIDYMKEYLKDYPDEEDKGWLNDACWLRFARARKNPLESLKMITECIKWRKEYKPYAIGFPDVAGILKMGTVFHFGFCKENRPIFYMTPGAKNTYGADKREQLIVYLMEETSRWHHETVTWVFDWSKFGDRGRDDESKKTREKVVKVLQDYYPERLGALYMVDTPWYFGLLYKVVGIFLDKKTKKKIHLCKNAEVINYVDPENLVKAFEGGLADPPVKRMDDSLHDEHASADPTSTSTTPCSPAKASSTPLEKSTEPL